MEDVADTSVLGGQAPILSLVTNSHAELESEPDDGLVTYMAFKAPGEERNLGLRACDELHRRHAHFLVAWCIKNRNETFGQSAEDFVNATFLKAYNEAGGFACTDREHASEQVLAWLFRIMKNLYLDALRSENRRPVLRCSAEEFERLEEIEEKRQEAAEAVPTGRKARMLSFLESLSPQDREILTVTAEYWNSENGEVEIDNEVRAHLCKQYGMTESSLRVRRLRLKQRAKAYIEQ